MADWLVVTGVPPYDGRYEFAGEVTSRELGWIKRLAGTMPADVEPGLRGGDAELYCVLAAIAILRAGKIAAADVPAVFEKLADAPYGSAIEIETDDEEAVEPDPPISPSSTGNGSTSGPGSTPSSATPLTTPHRSGTPGSDATESARPMSVT